MCHSFPNNTAYNLGIIPNITAWPWEQHCQEWANKKVRASSQPSPLVTLSASAEGKAVAVFVQLFLPGTQWCWMLWKWPGSDRSEQKAPRRHSISLEGMRPKKWHAQHNPLTEPSEQQRGLWAAWPSPLHCCSFNDISCHFCYASLYISLIIPPLGERGSWNSSWRCCRMGLCSHVAAAPCPSRGQVAKSSFGVLPALL